MEMDLDRARLKRGVTAGIIETRSPAEKEVRSRGEPREVPKLAHGFEEGGDLVPTRSARGRFLARFARSSASLTAFQARRATRARCSTRMGTNPYVTELASLGEWPPFRRPSVRATAGVWTNPVRRNGKRSNEPAPASPIRHDDRLSRRASNSSRRPSRCE
jgi:hypothetical protein